MDFQLKIGNKDGVNLKNPRTYGPRIPILGVLAENLSHSLYYDYGFTTIIT